MHPTSQTTHKVLPERMRNAGEILDGGTDPGDSIGDPGQLLTETPPFQSKRSLPVEAKLVKKALRSVILLGSSGV